MCTYIDIGDHLSLNICIHADIRNFMFIRMTECFNVLKMRRKKRRRFSMKSNKKKRKRKRKKAGSN